MRYIFKFNYLGGELMEDGRDFSNYGVPHEIKKWNWGAFMFNILWGIGNNCYITLLCLIPFFNIIWIFVCGAKGNQWAWEKGNYKDVETFMAVQKTWNKAGLVWFILAIVMIVFYIVIGVSAISSVLNTY